MAEPKNRSDGERLYLVVQHLGRRLRDVDLEMGISHARFAVLAHLAFHGANNVGELAALERVSRPAMTRLIRDMEKDGLARRLPDASDGRGVIVSLTAKGRTVLERVRNRKIALIEKELAPMDDAARQAIRTAVAVLGEK
jgi:DNA-binding MarR family transcriptional regulator